MNDFIFIIIIVVTTLFTLVALLSMASIIARIPTRIISLQHNALAWRPLFATTHIPGPLTLNINHCDVRHESSKPLMDTSQSQFKEAYSGSLLKKMQYWMGFSEVNIFKIRQSSIFLYEGCTDRLPYEKFFQQCQLEDTFFSFFLLLELHIWMCFVRSMRSGAEGRMLRNELTQRLWVDIDSRLKLVEIHRSKKRKEIMEDLLYHLQAAMFSYDEGLLTDDKVLAGALWRNLFQKQQVDPRTLEMMVNYVRTQSEHLKTIGPREWCIEGKLTWQKFPPLID